MPRKTNYVPSKIQTKCECYICHADYRNGLDHHHCLTSSRRTKANDDGLWVWLCRRCHSNLHDHGVYEKELKKIAQDTFIREQMKLGYPEDAAREIYFERYGKFYD